jgi:hypothetical protein
MDCRLSDPREALRWVVRHAPPFSLFSHRSLLGKHVHHYRFAGLRTFYKRPDVVANGL